MTATYIDTNPGVWGYVSLDSGSANFMGPVKAGQFNWQRTGGTYAGLQNAFATFCIEVHQDIFPGWQLYVRREHRRQRSAADQSVFTDADGA